jgi:alpha-L-fucosidase
MKVHPVTRFVACFMVLASLCGAIAQEPSAGQAAGVDKKETGRSGENWMADTRFGMFIHFGLYSLPGGVWKGEQSGRNFYSEWIRSQWGWPERSGIPRADYDTLLKQFNPTGFDAAEWIRLADEAGMEYFVITAKHHDGFALWDSKVSEYDIAATPFGATKRDLLGELVSECRKRGIKVGFYYSHWQDWEHSGGALPPWPEIKADPPLIQPTDAAFQQYWQQKCLPQITELMDNYQPDMFWFDTWGASSAKQITSARRDELIQLIRTKAPSCMINGRISSHDPAGADFISMGDNQFPDRKNAPKVPWETPATMNHSWGFNRLDFAWQPFDLLLERLIRNASHGGAITLNVGPMANGRFQDAAVRRLRQFAAWMAIHRHTLHGTSRDPFPENTLPEEILATSGKDRVFLHRIGPMPATTLKLPAIAIRGLGTGAARAQVLETREFLKTRRDGESISIDLPAHLAGLDHPVIQVGAESAIPHRYEDGADVTPVKPGDFSR